MEIHGKSGQAFIGVILLPIVGNAAEHATAVTSAYRGSLGVKGGKKQILNGLGRVNHTYF
jgi:hypothetical protein